MIVITFPFHRARQVFSCANGACAVSEAHKGVSSQDFPAGASAKRVFSCANGASAKRARPGFWEAA